MKSLGVVQSLYLFDIYAHITVENHTTNHQAGLDIGKYIVSWLKHSA